MLFLSTTKTAAFATLLLVFNAPSALGQTMTHGDAPITHSTDAPPGTATPSPSLGQTMLEHVQALEGKWDAQTKLGVLTDIFKPFALGTDVLTEEWINGKQITSTIFYVVNDGARPSRVGGKARR